MEKRISILFHNYYGQDQEWASFIGKNIISDHVLYVNTVRDSYYRLKEDAAMSGEAAFLEKDTNRHIVWRQSGNVGKDIGGKLVLMDAFLRLQDKSEYLLLLHDKRSPYHVNRDMWASGLLSIAEKDGLTKALSSMEKDERIGMMTAENTITQEEGDDKYSRESSLVKGLLRNYQLNPPDLRFAAGAMFLVRASIYKDFFIKYSPLEIRGSLGESKVLDNEGPTIMHGWERMLSWIVTSAGYKLDSL